MLRHRSVLLAATLAALLVPRADAAPVPVSGRVVDATGKAVAKAVVTLAPPRTGFAERLEAVSPAAPAAPAAQTVTDAGGGFRFAAPAEGMWVLGVTAPGFAVAELELFPLLEERDVDNLQLEKDEPLAVRVLGPDGKPLAGVRVWGRPRVEGIAALSRTGGRSGPRWGTTDATGTAVLPRAKGQFLEVAAFSAGLLPAAAVEVEGDTRSVELRLAAGCARRLEVRDAKGGAVAGALVSLGDRPLGRTDAAGLLAAVLPCQGKARIEVETAERQTATLEADPPTPGGAAPPLRLTLAPPVAITGRVLDAVSRSPLAGAVVWPSDDPAAFVRSDGKGAYAVTRSRKASASTHLRAAAREHRPDSRSLGALSGAATAAGPTFSLQPVVTLAGHVVDGRGKPVAGAVVTATEAAAGGLGGPGQMRIVRRIFSGGDGGALRSRTDAAGAFRLEVLPRHVYTLRARHADFAPGSLEVAERLEPGSSRRGLKIVLHAGQRAYGRVASAAGAPIVGATLELVPAAEGPARPFPAFLLGNAEEKGIAAASDAEGRFSFDHLTPGRFDIKASAEGFAPLTVRGIVIADQQEAIDLGTVTLAPGAVLTGFVVDARGKPVAGAAVSLAEARGLGGRVVIRGPRRSLGGDEREVRTQADGSFSFRNLTPGEAVDLTARKKGLLTASASRVKVPPAEPLRLTLQAAARLSGRVVDDQGTPVGVAPVWILPADGDRFGDVASLFTETDEEGKFVFETLEPGKVGVRANARGYLTSEARYVEVAVGREVSGVELVVKRGAVIEGIVTTSAGAPAAGAEVSLQSPTSFDRGIMIDLGAAAARGEADGDGHYRLEGVAEGAQSVAAELSGHQRAVRDLDVQPGTNRLDLRLGEGLRVSGRVVDGAGNPIAGAQVALSSSSSRMFQSGGEEVTGADGAFRFTGLSVGSYRLSASRQGYTPGEQDVQITEGPVDGVELRLNRGGAAITGRILGLDFGELSGVQVNAFKMGDNPGMDGFRQGQVDYEGQYRVEGVTPGDWRVMAALADGGRTVRKHVTLPEGGGDVQLDLLFESGLTLSGRVTRGGEAVDGATVATMGVGVESGGSAVTDSTGAFRVEGLKPGQYWLSVSHFQRGLQHSQTLDLETSREIEIELPVARVSGRVVDATSGAALAGVVLRAEKAGQPSSFFGPRAVSDNDGSFVLSGLAAGSHRILASKEGYGRAEKTVELPSDEASVAGIELALEPEAGLVLEVSTAVGGPPPSLSVALLNGAGQPIFTQLVEPGENGRTRIRDAPAGSWRILVGAQGFATVAQPVTVPSEAVPVVLSPAARLTVTVRELAGDEQPATLTVLGADGQPFRSLRFSSVVSERPLQLGTVEVNDLPAGTWTLRVAGPAGKNWEDTVTVRPGEALRRDL